MISLHKTYEGSSTGGRSKLGSAGSNDHGDYGSGARAGLGRMGVHLIRFSSFMPRKSA